MDNPVMRGITNAFGYNVVYLLHHLVRMGDLHIALDVFFGGWGVGAILLSEGARDEEQGQD
jgi:hypothetical protein